MWSGCCGGGLGQDQAADVIGSLGSLAAGCEERALVGFEQVNPRRDVAGIAHVAVETELRGQERGTEFGYAFFGGVVARAEPVLEVTVQTGFVSRPMREFVECGVVEVIRALERLEGGHEMKSRLGT